MRLWPVALHAESVDRNFYIVQLINSFSVALHAESVDRNSVPWWCIKCRPRSLSMRRAWIEIVMCS